LYIEIGIHVTFLYFFTSKMRFIEFWPHKAEKVEKKRRKMIEKSDADERSFKKK
jgi:hypothetical protein